MALKPDSIVQRLATEAIQLGAGSLEIEYKDGYEEVFAVTERSGQGIARPQSSTAEAKCMRVELYGLAKRKQRMILGDSEYELRCRVYDSFGEDAFCVELRRV